MRYALLGLVAVTILWLSPRPEHQQHDVQTNRPIHTDSSVNLKKTQTGEQVKKVKKLTWRDNPNNCNTNTHWIAKEKPFKCIKKTPVTNVTGNSLATGNSFRTETQVSTNCESYRHLVEKYSWNVNVAMQVMQAESGCNPNAANWADNHGVCMGSFGLFQISCHGGQIYDPAKNVAAAWAKYQANRWQPWGVCTSGKVNCY